MSLLKDSSINNNYTEKQEKPIHPPRKKINIKRVDLFLLIVIMIALLTPVIKGLFTKPKTAVSSDVNLYLSRQCENFFGKEMTEKLIREFEEKNPGIQIILADEAQEPDVLIFNDGDFNQLVSENALIELNSFTNYESGSLQMAIPLVSFMNLLFYNIDILSEAGFDSPPKTREEFTAYAKTVSQGESGASGAALSLSQSDHQSMSRDVFSWIWASGGNFWEDGDSQSALTAPSLAVRTTINEISFLETLFREGYLAQRVFETRGEQRIEQFANGRVALMIASSQVIPYLRGKMGDRAFGITTIPGLGTVGQYSTGLSAIYTAISAKSENPEQAWDFLVFLTGKSSLFCEELKAVPGVVSNIIPGEYVKDDPFYSKAWDIFEASQIARGFTGKPGADEYETIFFEELRSYFERTRTATQTVNAIQQRWNEVFINNEQEKIY